MSEHVLILHRNEQFYFGVYAHNSTLNEYKNHHFYRKSAPYLRTPPYTTIKPILPHTIMAESFNHTRTTRQTHEKENGLTRNIIDDYRKITEPTIILSNFGE